jgi:hypothetical protein
MSIVEIENQVVDEKEELSREDARGDENHAIRSLKQDTISRVLLIVAAVCGAGLILLLALIFSAGLLNSLRFNQNVITTVGEFLVGTVMGIFLLIVLFVLTLVSYFFLRRRLLNNPMFYPQAGCPQCWEYELVRVRRNKSERLVARLGIPVRRYSCRNCDWEGLRIGGPPSGVESQMGNPAIDYFWESDDVLNVHQAETTVEEKQ